MGWFKESQKWIAGNIPPEADLQDVIRWIENDPVWQKATEIRPIRNGSHLLCVVINGIGKFEPGWQQDYMTISSKNGRKVKAWIVSNLVKGHRYLCKVENGNEN